MPENKLIRNRIWMIAMIIIVSGVSAGLLTFFNIATKDRIAFNEEVKLKRSVLRVFDIPYGREDVIRLFDENIEIKEAPDRRIYQYRDRGKLKGVALEVKGPGFWGPITAMVALGPDLDIIKGMEILHQEETPGLGGRIAEEGFKNQFKGKNVVPEISFDAITGATMTSKAFKKIINENVRDFRETQKR